MIGPWLGSVLPQMLPAFQGQLTGGPCLLSTLTFMTQIFWKADNHTVFLRKPTGLEMGSR